MKKVGDTVKVKSFYDISETFLSPVSNITNNVVYKMEMDEFCGKSFTVKSADDIGVYLSNGGVRDYFFVYEWIENDDECPLRKEITKLKKKYQEISDNLARIEKMMEGGIK